MTDKEIEIVLEHVGKAAENAAMYKSAFRNMCTYFLSHMEGDDLYTEEAYALMYKHGIVDKDGFEIGEEDDDTND